MKKRKSKGLETADKRKETHERHIEKLNERIYLDGLYKHRKFIVACHERPNSFASVKLAYDTILSFFSKEIKKDDPESTIDYVLNSCCMYSQLSFAATQDKKFETIIYNYDPSIMEAFSKLLAQHHEMDDSFRICDNISREYGLFIYDLYSKPKYLQLSDLTDKINEADIFYPFPVKENMYNYMDCSDYNEQSEVKQKHIMGALDLARGVHTDSRIYESNLDDILKRSNYNREFKSSLVSRKTGIWLWDNIVSPLNKENIDFVTAINILFGEIRCDIKEDVDSFRRICHQILENTKQCILHGYFIPYKKSQNKKP